MISRYITKERHHKQCHRSILTTNLYSEIKKKKIEQKQLVISQTFINLSYKKRQHSMNFTWYYLGIYLRINIYISNRISTATNCSVLVHVLYIICMCMENIWWRKYEDSNSSFDGHSMPVTTNICEIHCFVYSI